MYKIEWIHRGEAVGSDQVGGTDTTEIVQAARAKAADVGKRHPGKDPDSFRIMDSSGAEIGSYSVSEKAFDGTT